MWHEIIDLITILVSVLSDNIYLFYALISVTGTIIIFWKMINFCHYAISCKHEHNIAMRKVWCHNTDFLFCKEQIETKQTN